MKYILLIYASEADYAKMNQEEQAANFQAHYAFSNDLVQRKISVGGAPLQPISTATTVRVRNGKMLTTDGPFAETKEQLGGLHLIECRDRAEAMAIAERIPTFAAGGVVEVRPVEFLTQR